MTIITILDIMMMIIIIIIIIIIRNKMNEDRKLSEQPPTRIV